MKRGNINQFMNIEKSNITCAIAHGEMKANVRTQNGIIFKIINK
jgi:hypothetical protein